MEVFRRKWSGFAMLSWFSEEDALALHLHGNPVIPCVMLEIPSSRLSVTRTGAQVADLERNPRKLLGGGGTHGRGRRCV